MPAGSPRWLRPAGSPLTHARRLPSAGKANPPTAAPSVHAAVRGISRRRPRESQPAGCGFLKPAGPRRWWSSQPVAAVYWPATDQSHFKLCSSLSSPGGLLIPPSCPMDFFWGGTKVPAVVAGLRDEATATKDHLPWPPELSAPPWPPSVCSALEAPSCVCICACPEGPPECPPPPPW